MGHVPNPMSARPPQFPRPVGGIAAPPARRSGRVAAPIAVGVLVLLAVTNCTSFATGLIAAGADLPAIAAAQGDANDAEERAESAEAHAADRVANAEEQIAEAHSAVADAEGLVTACERQLEDLQGQVDAALLTVTATEGERDAHAASIVEMEEQIADLQAELTTLRADLDAARQASASRPAPVAAPPTNNAPVTGGTSNPPASSSGGGATYYRNCDAVRAAGAAPLRPWDAGYRAGLDRDSDGYACE